MNTTVNTAISQAVFFCRRERAKEMARRRRIITGIRKEATPKCHKVKSAQTLIAIRSKTVTYCIIRFLFMAALRIVYGVEVVCQAAHGIAYVFILFRNGHITHWYGIALAVKPDRLFHPFQKFRFGRICEYVHPQLFIKASADNFHKVGLGSACMKLNECSDMKNGTA